MKIVSVEFGGGITIQNRIARLPDATGLGIEVDWAVLKRHQAEAGSDAG